MRRRELIAVFGGAAFGWCPLARGQQPAIPVISFLNSRSVADTGLLAGFRRGLSEGGYVEGRDVIIEYRWADGRYDLLPALAAELIRRPVSLLLATGGEPVALAAKAATSTVPTIFVVGGDPVKLGLAASYPRPGGNATGISIVTSELAAKRLGLAHDLLPEVTTIGFLVNPRFPTIEAQLRDTREAAQRIGLQIDVFNASTDNEIDLAFETIVQQGTRLLIIAADPFFDTRRGQLVALSAHHSVPSLYQSREYIGAGGLISYGIDLADVYRQAGVYATRILKGSAPGDLPILEQSKFELVINRTTAKVLGVNVPYVLLAQADEVIE